MGDRRANNTGVWLLFVSRSACTGYWPGRDRWTGNYFILLDVNVLPGLTASHQFFAEIDLLSLFSFGEVWCYEDGAIEVRFEVLQFI